jgi:hypothetical protein
LKSAPDLHGHKPIMTISAQSFPPSLSHPKPDGATYRGRLMGRTVAWWRDYLEDEGSEIEHWVCPHFYVSATLTSRITDLCSRTMKAEESWVEITIRQAQDDDDELGSVGWGRGPT